MSTYVRLGIAALNDVIPRIQANWSEPAAKAMIGGHSVGVSSLRMKTFGRDARASCGIACRTCGLEAEYFAIETFARGLVRSPHVNLYGVKDGIEVLFTHDHILARALGGKDSLMNTQTMCAPCNSKKSHNEQIEVERRRALTKQAQSNTI